MGEAVTAVVGMGTTIAGGIAQAKGAKATAQANSQMYRYQAGIADLNSKIMQQNQEYAIQVGEQQAYQEGLRGSQVMGRIRAVQGASGLDVRSGSNAQVQKSQTGLERLDQSVIRANASRTAVNFGEQSQMYQAQSAMDLAAAKDSLKAGNINATASILGTASSVANEWQQANQTGTFASFGSGGGGFGAPGAAGGGDTSGGTWSMFG